MGWRETLVRGVAIGEAEIERERHVVRVALKWPEPDRIALARELLAGTDRVVARELEPFIEDRKQQPFERGFDAGWNDAIDAMLVDPK